MTPEECQRLELEAAAMRGALNRALSALHAYGRRDEAAGAEVQAAYDAGVAAIDSNAGYALDQRLRDAEAEVAARTEKLMVPGVLACAKCAFRVERVEINPRSGAMRAGDNNTEPCPNGCGPLWQWTWEQQARETGEVVDQWAERAARAEDRAAALLAILTGVDGFNVGSDPDSPRRRRIERRPQISGEVRWVVSLGSHVARRDGTCEYEPMPSSRDDDFIARTRMTFAEACDAALLIVGVSRERVEQLRAVFGEGAPA